MEFKVMPYNNQPVFMAFEKLNGYQITVKKIAGKVSVLTRGKNDLTDSLQAIPDIAAELHSMPDDSEFVGELHAKNHDAAAVPTLLIAQSNELVISPFWIVKWAGKMKNGLLTHSLYETVLAYFRNTPMPELLSESNHRLKQKDIDKWLKEAIKRKIEGFVFYSTEGQAYKLKPVRTIDVVIHEINRSYDSTIRSVNVGVYADGQLIRLGSVSAGLTYQQKRMKNEELLNKVIEVSYQDITSNSKLKMPVFERFRDDEKKPSECLISQLEKPNYKSIKARKRERTFGTNEDVVISLTINENDYK